MAIPFAIAASLLVVAGILFLFGRRSESTAQKSAFIAVAGLLVLLTGVFMMADGLELPIQESITKSGDVHSIAYQTIYNDGESYLFVLSHVLAFFGFAIMVLSLVYAVLQFRERRAEARRDVLDWL